MKIESVSGYTPPPSGGRPPRKTADGESVPEKGAIFTGPHTGNLVGVLREMDSSRPELVERVRDEIAAGTYLSGEKLRTVVERLSLFL